MDLLPAHHFTIGPSRITYCTTFTSRTPSFSIGEGTASPRWSNTRRCRRFRLKSFSAGVSRRTLKDLARASSGSRRHVCSDTRSWRTHRIWVRAQRRRTTPRICGMHILVHLPGRLFGPNAKVRRHTRDLQRRLHTELGNPTLAERFMSVLAVGAALWTALTLKLKLFQHPSLLRTTYRIPDKSGSAFHLWEEIPNKISGLSIQVDLQHAKKQVWLRLEGVLSAANAERLAQRIQDSLARSKSRLVLDLNKLRCE